MVRSNRFAILENALNEAEAAITAAEEGIVVTKEGAVLLMMPDRAPYHGKPEGDALAVVLHDLLPSINSMVMERLQQFHSHCERLLCEACSDTLRATDPYLVDVPKQATPTVPCPNPTANDEDW